MLRRLWREPHPTPVWCWYRFWKFPRTIGSLMLSANPTHRIDRILRPLDSSPSNSDTSCHSRLTSIAFPHLWVFPRIMVDRREFWSDSSTGSTERGTSRPLYRIFGGSVRNRSKPLLFILASRIPWISNGGTAECLGALPRIICKGSTREALLPLCDRCRDQNPYLSATRLTQSRG